MEVFVPVTTAHVRAEARQLRAFGWSFRRIASRLQARHGLRPLVAYRLAHGWTQEDAARRWNERWPGSGPVKTGKAWSYWESWPGKGGRAPSAVTLWRLAELYRCRPGELLDGPDFGDLDARAAGVTQAGAEASGDVCVGLLPVAVALARGEEGDLPTTASIEALLAGLVSGWVPAA
ncbi:HTH cro/C1-type domain-containing protein [Frankia sp. AiPs1]|uniref:helix-turn-helix domain-containing protein n=1 Tax=Frankia sp. AiPa1 TaxID=573492 RepID=UPI00202B1CE3|nr:helix-turn-helix transcriptional regulator [Frankia sp. AiPa1]MCL9757745.1 helix-turn-helix transcriptional regulator [Frankia sp. AiPa1]